jgi:two-component system, sensor histidine kinase and response regulator
MTKVLLAEDEPALLELFRDVLHTMGLDCVSAADGAEAITLAQQHRPELIVTDYMMPQRTGVEVMNAVQADPSLAHVPVILMSAGRPPTTDRQQAWRFLPKPVDVDTFEQAVREAIATASAAASSPINFQPAEGHVSPLGLAREEMLGWVSHEIKSPLSAAMSATQLAMRILGTGEDPHMVEHRLTQTLRQLKRIDELVNALLDAAQLQDGKLDLEKNELDLSQLVEKVGAYWKDTHPELVFEMRVPQENTVVRGDAERLRQILDNLVSNAVKYGDKKPIVVELVTEGERVIVRVTDHGRGIAPTAIARIFDRFHRVPGQGGRGHGLGLYIAAALARLHDGEVSVASKVDRGSTFTLTLPAAFASRAAGMLDELRAERG